MTISASDVNGTLDHAFRQRSMTELEALMARVSPADLTIQELLGVTALLHAADHRRAGGAPGGEAQVLRFVRSGRDFGD